jgi:hypothetical protein
MKRIIYWLRSYKKLKTIKEVQQMGLSHFTNIYGDGITRLNCRSLWRDKFENIYKCDELFEGGRDIVAEMLLESHPGLFNKAINNK